VESRNTGGIGPFAFLAWLLSLAGPIASIWLLMRGVLRLLPTLIESALPSTVGDILIEHSLGEAALAGGLYLLGLTMSLFSTIYGGFSLFAGLSLLMPGLFLLFFFAISLRATLRGKFTLARILLVLQFLLYSGSGLLCHLAISRVADAIGIVETPYSFAPYVVFVASALACSFLVMAYMKITRIRQSAVW